MEVHHSGEFREKPNKVYVGGQMDYIDEYGIKLVENHQVDGDVSVDKGKRISSECDESDNEYQPNSNSSKYDLFLYTASRFNHWFTIKYQGLGNEYQTLVQRPMLASKKKLVVPEVMVMGSKIKEYINEIWYQFDHILKWCQHDSQVLVSHGVKETCERSLRRLGQLLSFLGGSGELANDALELIQNAGDLFDRLSD
ncbi:unnamed protein product [Ilex paraguariensis]|uniref:Uncharacterized protein n=1 Tax=Ilex paraguariensis TaxID=185542 RepID=A0ABC8SPH4_9AQUA